MQHTEEVLEGIQVINECLKYWLKVFKQEGEVVVDEGEISHVVKETRVDTSLLILIKFTSIQRRMNDYITVIRKLRYKLLFESKFAGIKHEKDIAERDAYKSIKEVRVDAISREVSRAVLREIPRAIYGTTFEAIRQVKKAEIELRKVEENVQ